MSWPFDLYTPPDGIDENDLATMFDEVRSFLATLAGASPGSAEIERLTADLRTWRERLMPYLTDDENAPYGQLNLDHEHGLASLPEISIEAESAGSVDATVTFSRWHLGGGGTVHGGQVAMALDAMMGHSQLVGGWIARTAHLKVSYLAGTPFGRPLRLEVRTTSSSGRKHHLSARLLDQTAVLAEATALFVRVAPYPAVSGGAGIALTEAG